MRFDVVVETPRGSRNKYEMDPDQRHIRLDRLLFTATVYPYDYGFLPDTLAEDGDPLDAMVLGEVPTFPGCLIRVRPVAVFWMSDEAGPDAKILSIPADDPRFEGCQDMDDVPVHVRGEIGHFFDVYKDLEPGKTANVRGWEPRECAEILIDEAMLRFRRHAPIPGQP
ncbi:inorganic diphosphatase [Nonomuraea sp. LPB2021202275-12-8]|uniref:inorganic diphosphatase n=1 Tax=Nonomuraea sp. LPB2021202275-12-8 TaxID=3120159 RepID=UPI00300C3166